MTNDFTSKWDEYVHLGWNAGVFRVFPEHFLDFYVGFSPAGERQFTFKWTVETEKEPAEFSYEFKQIRVSQGRNYDERYLLLTLVNRDLSDIFSIVCFDLAQSTKCAKSTDAGVSIFFNRLKRWSELLSKRSTQQMSFQERLGLMGELCILDWLTSETTLPIDVLINGWRGPAGDTNDVGLNGSRLEIKAQLSTQPLGINVSSLTQLADDGRYLFLILLRFSASANGTSLADLVNNIQRKIGSRGSVLMDFHRKLVLTGYDENEAYCHECMQLDQRLIYSVEAEFPRLHPPVVPQGISKVRYFIEGDYIARFAIDDHELRKRLHEI